MAIAKINYLTMIGVKLEVQCCKLINFSNNHVQTVEFFKLIVGKLL